MSKKVRVMTKPEIQDRLDVLEMEETENTHASGLITLKEIYCIQGSLLSKQ